MTHDEVLIDDENKIIPRNYIYKMRIRMLKVKKLNPNFQLNLKFVKIYHCMIKRVFSISGLLLKQIMFNKLNLPTVRYLLCAF